MASKEVVRQRVVYALLPLIERALLNDTLPWLAHPRVGTPHF